LRSRLAVHAGAWSECEPARVGEAETGVARRAFGEHGGEEAGPLIEVVGQDDLDYDYDAELSGGMYATEAESREQVSDFYRRVWADSDAAIQELPLDARGTVPWWPEDNRHPTLHILLVHTIQETARHAGVRPGAAAHPGRAKAGQKPNVSASKRPTRVGRYGYDGQCCGRSDRQRD
jgi:hypothetical protein